ncbi:uncharacterized protein LY89DRAFT_764883 [Mollisia scopiformis]|uniref:Uncharacterized protein n=1 Tax=Mollisia scopiformis TaxID=149040 RepID=A0A132B6V4_MOLSC|nr:uncharacterized protein LY89DRAFT_764883 [Mollisia scopiformis]KUJ08145.1 hypothetical protein LY89DRAFT_764883 [Mollisia scopiformis]
MSEGFIYRPEWRKPHCLRGAPLKALVELFESYDLLPPEQVAVLTQAVDGLRLLDGFHPIWRPCKLQTFFAETRLVRYFVVNGAIGAAAAGTNDLDSGEADFFKQLDKDAAIVEEDAKAKANIVHGFNSHRSAVVPWLRRIGIEEHTRGLKKDEMHASFAVPKNADDEPELFLMLELALSRFHTAAVGRARGFDPKKEPNTRKTNFGYWKQFLTYCYRVAYCGGHFTTADDDQRTPESSIQLTGAQEKAWEAAFQSAVEQDRPGLRDVILVLSMALICHEFGGNRYSSPLLSFCAMLSVKPYTKTWKEPGNYNSCLSGVIWVVQLIIFHASACLEKAELGDTLERIKQYCGCLLSRRRSLGRTKHSGMWTRRS